MDPLRKIQDAERQIATAQDTLDSIQNGLEKAETLVTTAEEARRKSEVLLKVTMGLLVGSILVVLLSRRRSSASD